MYVNKGLICSFATLECSQNNEKDVQDCRPSLKFFPWQGDVDCDVFLSHCGAGCTWNMGLMEEPIVWTYSFVQIC